MAAPRTLWLPILLFWTRSCASPLRYAAAGTDHARFKSAVLPLRVSPDTIGHPRPSLAFLRAKASDDKPTASEGKAAPAKHKEWHQDVNFLSKLMMLMLPCMVLSVAAFELLHRSWADVDFDAPTPAMNSEESHMDLSKLFLGFGQLTKPYFCSPAGFKGRIYILVVLLLGVCALFLALVHNAWQKDFWDTFEQKNSVRFFHLLGIFIVLVATFVLNDVYSQYIRQMLYINWRDFMTRRFVHQWLGANAYYTMQLDQDPRRRVENPDQRIQEDIHLFVDSTIIISYEFLNSLGHLIVFLPLLLMLSPPKAFGIFFCPGWLLYLAFLYSLLGTLATHCIGKRLIPIGFARQQYEADFRFGLVRVRDHSESIVLYRGERSEEQNLSERFERIKAMWWQYMLYTKRLSYFTRSFSMAQMIMPFFILAPSYFQGDITLGSLFQITQALGSVCTAFDCIINHFSTLTSWRATADRLLGFEKAMAEARKCLDDCKAVRHPGLPAKPLDGRDPDSLGLAVQGLTVRLPDGQLLWKDLSFAIPRGQRVLFTGREGIGKSVLFRALAGAWPYVDSGQLWMLPPEVTGQKGEGAHKDEAAEEDQGVEEAKEERNLLPAAVHTVCGRRVLFVPQRSYFPAFCTLRGALAYPEPPQTYADFEYMDALREVKLEGIAEGDDTILSADEIKSKAKSKDEPTESGPLIKGTGLDLEAKWSMVLSPGQQQRLAFARVLLLRPDLLFLDEATSNVGQDSAKELYALLHSRLGPETTIVSISHEVDLLSPLHDRTLIVESDESICSGLQTLGGDADAVPPRPAAATAEAAGDSYP